MDETAHDLPAPTPVGSPAARTDSTKPPPPTGRASGYPTRSVVAYTAARERFLELHAGIVSRSADED